MPRQCGGGRIQRKPLCADPKPFDQVLLYSRDAQPETFRYFFGGQARYFSKKEDLAALRRQGVNDLAQP